MPRLMKTRPTRTLPTARPPSDDNSCRRLLPHQYVTTTTTATATLHTTATTTTTSSGCPVSSPDFEWIWDVADPRRVFFSGDDHHHHHPNDAPEPSTTTIIPGDSVDSPSAKGQQPEQPDQAADLNCKNTVDARRRRYARLWRADRAPGHPLGLSAEQLAHISARIDDAAAAVVAGGWLGGWVVS
ncbi:hypothetical protein SLS58_008229 [Diplodia intermedia]|uniref:Uncharacterized protein n=1 Tax=Diplodia intermedia TaxID=856260 RepID=A0ABR3THZ6_9PEZI